MSVSQVLLFQKQFNLEEGSSIYIPNKFLKKIDAFKKKVYGKFRIIDEVLHS